MTRVCAPCSPVKERERSREREREWERERERKGESERERGRERERESCIYMQEESVGVLYAFLIQSACVIEL